MFAGEHCHPSFYSTGHGAYLTGRSAAQLCVRCAKERVTNTGVGEVTYNLQDASVTDLSAWLSELSTGDKKLEVTNQKSVFSQLTNQRSVFIVK